MALVQLQTLRTRVRQACDMENSPFVSDAELTTYVNESADELYDLLVAAYEDYFTTSSTFTTVSGTETVTLPSDFYKLIGVDIQVDGVNWKSLLPFNVKERNTFRNAPTVLLPSVFDTRYWLKAGVLHLLPVPTSALAGKLWYVPQRTQLVNNTDAFDGVNGWEAYIVQDCAAKCAAKEEGDPSPYIAQRARIEERIRRLSSHRDAGAVLTVTDVYADEGGYL